MAATNQFAVLLRDGDRPTAEQIRRAFRSFHNLTDVDAIRLAANAQGILMRQLGVDEAKAFQRALVAEGVAVALVAESDLKSLLPQSRSLHRVELSDDALLVFDLLGKFKPVSWNEIVLVATGAVQRVDVTRTLGERTSVRANPVFGIWPAKTTEPVSKVESETQLILQMVLADGATRFEINAAEFPFKYVVDRPELSTMGKLAWLVREIARRAPQALLNRGALDVRDGVDLVRSYPNRQAFMDEMLWLLWGATQKRRNA